MPDGHDDGQSAERTLRNGDPQCCSKRVGLSRQVLENVRHCQCKDQQGCDRNGPTMQRTGNIVAERNQPQLRHSWRQHEEGKRWRPPEWAMTMVNRLRTVFFDEGRPVETEKRADGADGKDKQAGEDQRGALGCSLQPLAE